MRLHRLIAILLLVESRGKMKANELAVALETSVRSIYRDIDVLAEAGIPMVTTPGPGGGISLMQGYTVNLRQLHGEEVLHLFLTGMGIPPARQSESAMKLNNALLKLENSLPAPYREDILKAKSRFYFDDTPWWSERAELPFLEALRTAVWRSNKIQIQYLKVNGELSSRTLRPYGLVVKQGEWYLVAYCEEAEEIRTFKCERVSSVKNTEDEYMIPADFSLEKYWRREEESFKQTCREEEFYPVVIRTAKANRELGKRVDVIDRVEIDEFTVLTVNFYSYEAACEQVMTLLNQAEILEPLVLREYIKERIRQLQNVYL